MSTVATRGSILVVEDEESIRNNLVRLLKLEGYQIASAANGKEGLARAREFKPDLMISDVNMPEMDGFDLLDNIRGDAELADTPFILLTALGDRANMRRGMTLNASDYIPKPFTREEILEAVRSQLMHRNQIERKINARIDAAVALEEEKILNRYAASFSGKSAVPLVEAAPRSDVAPDSVVEASVLFADIRSFTSISERLSAVEVAELLSHYFDEVCEPILKNGGHHLKFIGDGVMAVFSEANHASPIHHARRAVSAALGMVLAANRVREWVNQRYAERGIPEFAIGIGLHSGEVMFARMGSAQTAEVTPLGDTVNTASRLETASKELGWTIVVSEACTALAGQGLELHARHTVHVRGKVDSVAVVELRGLETDARDKLHGMATLTVQAQEIRAAVAANSEITARAVKQALDATLVAMKALTGQADVSPGSPHVTFKGYRVLKKIGAGGMSEVYLAETQNDHQPLVLKIMETGPSTDPDMLNRFILEYALLSQIDHPNVAKIYDQGFTDAHAYISMEYFAGGDVRGKLDRPFALNDAIAVVRQTAQALEAIHARNIIHRDLKPDNLMIRADGSIALADFGIAKEITTERNDFNHTRHGIVLGTPYYLSPEQATGMPLNSQADLYSLGVVLYELLMGERPYVSNSLEALLHMHVSAPIPKLTTQYAALQPMLTRMMAKHPLDRYKSATDILAELTKFS